MTWVKWDPFGNISLLQDRINRVFDDAFRQPQGYEDDISAGTWKPMVDIFEGESGIVVQAELPGVRKEDVTVEIKDNILTLSGERKAGAPESETRYYRKERVLGKFHRSFTLQEQIQPDQIKAKFKDGVLEVEIPRVAAEKPKQVTVQID